MQQNNYSWTLLILYSTCSLELDIVGSKENIPKYGQSGYLSVANGRNGDLDFDIVKNELFGEDDHYLERNERESRFKRTQPMVIDSGYGSRLSAAAKLARDRALQIHVFGNRGPGKRSIMLHHEKMISLSLRVLVKRAIGYGAVIKAGHKTGYACYLFTAACMNRTHR